MGVLQLICILHGSTGDVENFLRGQNSTIPYFQHCPINEPQCHKANVLGIKASTGI
jgi:hypothetical protein